MNPNKSKEGMIYGHLNHRYLDDMITKEDVDKEMKEIVSYFQGKADIKKWMIINKRLFGWLQ